MMAVSMASTACASTCARLSVDFGLPRRPASAGSFRVAPIGLLSKGKLRFTASRRSQGSEARCRKSLSVVATSNVEEEKSSLVKVESERTGDWSSLAQAATNIWKSLQTPVLAALLVFFLALQVPDAALAAKSGGRVGGRSFSSSRSYSAPSRSAPSSSYSAPRLGGGGGGSTNIYVAPSARYSAPYFWGWGGPSVVVAPGGYGYGYGGGGFSWLFTLFLVLGVAYLAYSYLGSNQDDDDEGYVIPQRVSVMKVQVGLLGIARTLQQDLDQLAESSDTSSPEGLNFLLQETILSLMRHPDYCVYGASSVDVKRNLDSGEQAFNQLSLEERGKFKAETLSNVGSVRRRNSNLAVDGGPNEFIVVTILVAAEGEYKLPYVGNMQDLKAALSTLGSVGASSTLAVEILWTPQDEKDSLTARDLLSDFPTLRNL